MDQSNQQQPDLVDAFTYSTTQRLLQTSFRANYLAQIETLRRARGYRARYYTSPNDLFEPIAAGGQAEYQIRMVPGTYVWGVALYASITSLVRCLVTDVCTEIPLFSDYVQAAQLVQNPNTFPARFPQFLGQPRLILEPGQVNVEFYNDNTDPVTVQLVLYCAEPIPRNPTIAESNRFSPEERYM